MEIESQYVLQPMISNNQNFYEKFKENIKSLMNLMLLCYVERIFIAIYPSAKVTLLYYERELSLPFSASLRTAGLLSCSRALLNR
jgi:hypothetical protein